jgi:hypothetical protein
MTLVLPETATLTVTEAGSGSSVSVGLSGTSCSCDSLFITPVTSDLGTVLVGTTGPATVFTLTNTGSYDTGVLTALISSTEFTITNDTCTGVALVAKTGSCTVSVALRPMTVGAKTATLKVNDPEGTPAVRNLTGVGTNVAPLPADPPAIDFGSVPVGQTSAAQTVTFKNSGGMSTGALTIKMSGDSWAFPVSDVTCTGALAPGASCTFKVSFAPIAATSAAAAYTVTDGSFAATVAVAGLGTP